MIQSLEWSGSAFEIGCQRGESQRDAISELAAHVTSQQSAVVTCDGRRRPLREYLEELWHESSIYAPELAEELLGVAQGAKLPVMEVVALNAFLDLISVRPVSADRDLSGCTSLAAGPPCTAGNAVYLCQNFDVEDVYLPHVIVAKVVKTTGPAQLVMTLPGVLGCIGLNDEGLSLAINFIHANDVTTGVSFPFFVRTILAQRRIGDAIGAATVPTRACGIHYLMATPDGLIASVETSGTDYDVRFPDSFSTHANHYRSEQMRSVR